MTNSNLNSEKLTTEASSNIHQYPSIVSLQCSNEVLAATLSDGRSVIVPIAWFPRLRKASLEQLKKFEIAFDGEDITWPELDEDISVKTFIGGLNNSCC